jgi:hypothetical protein
MEEEEEDDPEESDDELCDCHSDRTTVDGRRQCPSGRYWRGIGLCGCSFASNYGWIREVWVRGDGMGASRPGAVTPRPARTSAETPGRSARVGLLGLQCSAGALLRSSAELINKYFPHSTGERRMPSFRSAVPEAGHG